MPGEPNADGREVVEFAPGLGLTAPMTLKNCPATSRVDKSAAPSRLKTEGAALVM